MEMKLKWVLVVVLGLAEMAAGGEAIQLGILPGGVRVRAEEPVKEAAAVAEIFCARGEVESFQVVVQAVGENLYGLEAAMSPLRTAEGQTIAAENIHLYREIYIPLRYSSPRATERPGLIADPLVPFVDPYTEKELPEPRWGKERREGVRFGATRFDLWQGQNQPLWVDVRVPMETKAGTYEARFKVWTSYAKGVEIPVRVVVWDFVLPEGPTHENHFGTFSYMATYHGLKRNSPEYYRLEDRYIEMMAAHRINPPLPERLWPRISEDGTAMFDEETDLRITEFVERYHVTNIDVPRARFEDVLGKNRDKAIRFYRSWYAYLQKKGWAGRSYIYMLDEPNEKEAYERVRQLGALVKEAAPELRRLVVEQPYTQNADWGVLDEAIDIWCPLFGFVHEVSVQRVISAGDEVWSYTALVQRAPGYNPDYAKVKDDNPPYWQMDFLLTAYRIAPWLNRRYGITGLLYWTTVCWSAPSRNPWDDPGFRLNFNGEGQLFYPGEDAGVEGPIASIRLKNLRDGMEDYEYFVLLEKKGGKAAVEQMVGSVVPSWGSWRQDPYQLEQLRRRLAEEILRR